MNLSDEKRPSKRVSEEDRGKGREAVIGDHDAGTEVGTSEEGSAGAGGETGDEAGEENEVAAVPESMIFCVHRPQQHGLSNSREYNTWCNIKTRCFNPRNKAYKRYGARGITMCELWRHNFSEFYAEIGPKPSPRHSVDRINNDLGYEPGNVRWATQKEQCRNRHNNTLITKDGVTKTLAEWCEMNGVSDRYSAIRYRVRDKCPVAELFMPGNRTRKLLTLRKDKYAVQINGETVHVSELSRQINVPVTTLMARILNGDVGEYLMRPSGEGLRKEKCCVDINGETIHLKELAERTGIPYKSLWRRHQYGDVGDRLTRPLRILRSHSKQAK